MIKTTLSEAQMAARIARELEDGFCVNLGIGLPTLVSSHLAPGKQIFFHAENGIIGVGPHAAPGMEDKDLGNAGDENVTVIPGACFFDSAMSFALIRGGHLDVTVLGAFQVSEKGDLANWKLPTRKLGSFGGGMDLAVGAKKVIIMMRHITNKGEPRIVKECSYSLTAKRCVSMVVTDVAVIEVTPDGLRLREMAPGWSVEEIQAITEPPLITEGATVWDV